MQILLCLALSSLVLFLPPGSVAGQEWTRFRGPNGSGLSSATAVPVRWTAKDYNWKVQLPGVGHSSPVLWGKRIFITSGDEKTGTRTLLCLGAGDGRRLWARAFIGEKHGKHADNSFATATPAVDERHVYVCWGSPKQLLVVALNHQGKETWRRDLGPFRSGHGFGSSPVLVGDLLAVPDDQDGQSTLFGLNSDTGKVCWKVPRRGKATYTTPCVFQAKDKAPELIFTNYEHGITSVNPKTGKINWEIDVFHKAHVETGIASPIVADGLVFGTCGWLGVRQEVVAVRPGGQSGRDKPQEAYRIARSVPLCTTPLVLGHLLFLWGDRGVVTCADARSGKVYWRERVQGSFYGSPVCVGRHLYCMSREGDVLVLAATEKYKLLSRNPLGEGSHSTPAVAGGVLYLRTFTHLISVGGKGRQDRSR